MGFERLGGVASASRSTRSSSLIKVRSCSQRMEGHTFCLAAMRTELLLATFLITTRNWCLWLPTVHRMPLHVAGMSSSSTAVKIKIGLWVPSFSKNLEFTALAAARERQIEKAQLKIAVSMCVQSSQLGLLSNVSFCLVFGKTLCLTWSKKISLRVRCG